MKVSIITSCYNRKDTIAGAIESVLSQDYDDIEYIVVDGASTDGSLEIIRQYENPDVRYKHNISKIICEPDNGMYEAINKGIRAATGDVIALCHSDDYIYDNHVVSRVVEEMEKTAADFLYADGIFVSFADTQKVIRNWIGGEYANWKVTNGWLPLHPTCYIRRELMERLGLYDTSLKIAADTDLLYRYLSRKDIKVAYLKQYVTRMRMGGLSTDSAKRKQMWDEDITVYSRYSRVPHLRKIEKMMWKVPQFISAYFK